jgi:hypothetical protein
MKEKVTTIKAAIAIIFAGINSRNQERGINKQYKYSSLPVEEEDFKGWEFTLSVKEFIQVLRFKRPNNIDRYNMEYNVLMAVMSSCIETALLTWEHVGKELNVNKEMQKIALKALQDGEENNNNTN